VADAEVLFGPNALNYARTTFGTEQSFGMLDRRRIDTDHSVLLLRIDKLTIVDWSHDGKCYIWRDGNRRAPVLWPNPPKQLYTRDELRMGSDNDGVSHMASQNGSWQARIAEYIRRHTGINASAREYMPSR
jgi:hypothetical protein